MGPAWGQGPPSTERSQHPQAALALLNLGGVRRLRNGAEGSNWSETEVQIHTGRRLKGNGLQGSRDRTDCPTSDKT